MARKPDVTPPPNSATMRSFVHWIRAAAPYVHAFRDKTFVIAFGGEVVADESFPHWITPCTRSSSRLAHPYVGTLMRALSDLASGYALIPLSVVMFIYMRHRGHHAVRFIPWMVVGAYAVFTLTKWIVGGPAPGCPLRLPERSHVRRRRVLRRPDLSRVDHRVRPVWRWTATAGLVL